MLAQPGRERHRGEHADDPLVVLRAKLRSPKGRTWLGVGLDVALTVLLVALGWAPVLEAVQAQARSAGYLLAALHVVLVPVVLAIGSNDGAVTDATPAKTRWESAVGFAYFAFLAMGWLAPICAYTIGRPASFVIYPTIFIHVAPIVLLFALAILETIFGPSISRGANAFVGAAARVFTVPNLTILFAVYLVLIEAFLLLVKTRHGDLGRIALPAWTISYLPARLFFARITGLRGPERWTFAASNLHLLVRLFLTHPA